MLEVEHRLRRRIRAATTRTGKVLGALALWLVLVGSKYVVLLLEHVVFGGRVQLGGFFLVAGLIVLLMLARAGVRWLLGRGSGDSGPAPAA